MALSSKIFDSLSGHTFNDKRTICEVLKQIYDLAYVSLCKSNPVVLEKMIALLEEAYADGIKMTKKLVDYKLSMPHWEENTSIEQAQKIRNLREYLTKQLNYSDRLKLALVFDPEDYKFTNESYSKTYNDMRLALINRFGSVQRVSKNCSYKDINADIIIFFDPHSTHHNLLIEGIDKHPAVKYEYMNDPHQLPFSGTYPNGQQFYKLSSVERCTRAQARKVDYIITPSMWGFDKYLKPNLKNGIEPLFFPPVPRIPKIICPPLKDRKYGVTCQGHLWQGKNGFQPYDFRRWAAKQKNVLYLPHYVQNKYAPVREAYVASLTIFKGAVAACEYYAVAKYFEIPLAGCLLFAQECKDFDKLGFKDGENCITVNKENFHDRVNDFNKDPEKYQVIADAGRVHVMENWTAEKFADRIYNHCAEVINGRK